MALELGWVDIGLLTFLMLSVLVGVARGLVFEVLSLAGWFAAYFAALEWSEWLLPLVPVGEPGSQLRHAVAFAAVFLAALIACNLAARLVRSLVRATPLSPVDRLFGAAFGTLRGTIGLLFLAAVVSVTPLAHSTQWQQSRGAVWLKALLQTLNLSNEVIQPRSA